MSAPSGSRRPRWRVAELSLACALAGLLGSGCSEKPAGNLVWKQDLVGIKTALSGVVVFSAHDALAVGHALPEFSLVAHPVWLRWTGSDWTEVPMPGVGSTALRATTLDSEGSVWAVGRSVTSEAEPSDAVPLVYRYQAGAWTVLPLDELGPQVGVVLTGVATAGRGPELEVRAVGDSVASAGRVFRWIGGHWSVMTTPAVAGSGWTLRGIAHGPDGVWYAVGRRTGQVGGTVLVDRGSGWQVVAGPPIEVDWTAVATDGRGTPYFAGNLSIVGHARGVLYRLRGEWSEVPIALTLPAAFISSASDSTSRATAGRWVGAIRARRSSPGPRRKVGSSLASRPRSKRTPSKSK